MKKTKPVMVVVPNTTKEKMAAIVNLSQAVLELSRALSSVNVQAEISYCTFNHAPLTITQE